MDANRDASAQQPVSPPEQQGDRRADLDGGAALTARPDGPAARIGARLRALPTAVVAAIVTFVGYVVLSVIMGGLGLLLTKVFLPGPIGRWDNGVNRWFLLRRTAFWNTWTDVGSVLAGTGTIVGIAGIAVVILLIRRHWREITLLVTGLLAEISVFLTTTLIVPRARPSVPKLDAVPATSSFPSGHVAAAIVLYVGLAIVISARIRSVFARALVWVIALLLPVDVAFSRMYRGMHHPTDVMASLILGPGCLLLAVLATRSAFAASDLRDGREMQAHPTPEQLEAAR